MAETLLSWECFPSGLIIFHSQNEKEINVLTQASQFAYVGNFNEKWWYVDFTKEISKWILM